MTTEKQFPSGAWLVSDVINGQYIKRVYFGYTKREAQQAFKREVAKLQAEQEGEA